LHSLLIKISEEAIGTMYVLYVRMILQSMVSKTTFTDRLSNRKRYSTPRHDVKLDQQIDVVIAFWARYLLSI
jgi:hypothetical protein